MRSRLITLAAAGLLAVAAMGPAAVAQDRGEQSTGQDRAQEVRSANAAAERKLHPRLQEAVHSSDEVLVGVTVAGDPADAERYLDDAHTAAADGLSLTVGRVRGTILPKLASAAGVVTVVPIDFAQTGRPLGIPDDEVGKQADPRALEARIKNFRDDEVPYDEAPPLAESNFDEILAEEPVLDAKTHGFHEAWQAGFTGEGSRVAVLDGGTDFGHPDLIGTWATNPATGWPEAYDPYGTLLWLLAPQMVEQGLGWYSITEPVELPPGKTKGKGPGVADIVKVRHSVPTGPARNFAAPSGSNTHHYTLRGSWSKSGTVHMSWHPDDLLLAVYGERPAVLVTDPNEAGVYDTVYVDLDNDYTFVDEKPVTKDSPVSYRDMDGDRFTDLSGGLLYHISDGETPLPGGPTAFGVNIVGDPGQILAWSGDFDPAIGGHGTLTASNVAGQGVINGLAPDFRDTGQTPGAVIGGAPDADLVAFGDIYFSFDFSTQFGYFLSNAAGVDVTSNSYGDSAVDNDGFDAASQEADVIHSLFGNQTLPIFSTGNGAPGMGTTAPPAPAHGLSTGASTQFGATGWDSILDYSQVVDNDVMVWSNRGPGATGAMGVDIVADGAFSAGNITLNAVMDGTVAWNTWGGTSRSTPVAAGAAALVYQALRENEALPSGGAGDLVKSMLKSSSTDLGYSSFVQGAGSLHAGRAVEAALGSGATVTPDEWRAGDYRGDEWEVFPHVLAPGESDSQTFEIAGDDSGWTVTDRQLRKVDTITFDFESEHVADESPYTFNAPNYLIDITEELAAHGDADLAVIRMNWDFDDFDVDGDYMSDNEWRLLTYSWTDQDGDDELWNDADGDGIVDLALLNQSSNIDGFPDIDFEKSEIDEGEYVRFMYHRAGANTLQNFIRDPGQRLEDADGIFIGLQHTIRTDDVPTTTLEFQIDFYENDDWDWLAATGGDGSIEATLTVPEDAAYGMYDGAIVLEKDDQQIVVPVAVTVVAEAALDEDGNLGDPITFGGVDQSDLLMDNGSFFGASDWTWRAESGDWRFFYLDLPAEPAAGTQLLVDSSWDGGDHTDLDTLVFGRGENHFQLFGDAVFGAPYVLDTVGKSQNTNVGGGVWQFHTATGGPREIVAAPAGEGLHAVVHHQVLHEGDRFHTPFTTTVGGASVAPAAIVEGVSADTGSFEVTFRSSLDLTGLAVEGFGLSQPETIEFLPQQDDPNVPSSASTKHTFTVSHGASIDVETFDASNDLDLFLVYDANGDGNFTSNEIIGSSTTPSGAEHIRVSSPADGDYQVWVQGWSVTDATTVQELRVDVVQGIDVTVTGAPVGAVPAGTPVTLTVAFDRTGDPMEVGATYRGVVLLGPEEAPAALSVPLELTRVEGSS
jgi:hypothetical protein